MKRGFKTWAEKEARELRQRLGLRAWERLPSETLAQHLKVDILDPSRISGLAEAQLTTLLSFRSSEWSAAMLITDEGNHLIIENPTHSPKRREATRFHECAHIICGHKPTAFEQFNGVGLIIRGHDKEQEDEADWLGGCLHLPKPVLGFCLNRKYSSEQISEYALASEDLVRYRLNKSGALAIRRHMSAAFGRS